MKRALSILVAGLLLTGCTPLNKQVVSESAKPKTGRDVPEPVKKLLPAEQVNEKNAQSQAKLLEETLNRESGNERAATASRDR